MQTALRIHDAYPANRSQLLSKQPVKSRYRRLDETAWARQRSSSLKADSCLHCHHIHNAKHEAFFRSGRAIPDRELFIWPMPDVIGLRLNPREQATVLHVTARSPAAIAGLRNGDRILEVSGGPIGSTADLQWILHNARDRGALSLSVNRNGEILRIVLRLPEGWRRKSNISWRTTTTYLREHVVGSMRVTDLPNADRQRLGLSMTQTALRISQSIWKSTPAGRAGFLRGDIVIKVAGRSDRMSEGELLAHLLQDPKVERPIRFRVLRSGAVLDLKLP